jgi:hypothetical protein
MTSDGLLLFFESSRSINKIDGGYVNDRSRIWSTTRNSANPGVQFAEPYIQDIFKVDEALFEGSPFLHPDGKLLYFTSGGRAGNKGGLDIFVAQLGDFGAALSIAPVDAVDTVDSELMPVISRDNRVLYFAREGLDRKILVSKRSSTAAPFESPSEVSELNVAWDWPSWLSDDQCRLYFVSTRPAPNDAGPSTPYRLWVAEHPK